MQRRNFIFCVFFLSTVASAEPGFVAGLQPDSRPDGAPVIKTFEPDAAWQAQTVKGVGDPPTGLGFLKDQGAWYTPFVHPGLLGRYDIRGLHDTPNRKD